MPKFVVFLYLGKPEAIKELSQIGLEGLLFRPGTSLIGIDTGAIPKSEREKIVREYELREFEVDQEKFQSIIKSLGQFGARLTHVEFVAPDQLQTNIDDYYRALDNQDLSTVSEIIRECWNEGYDVKSLEYYIDGSRIRYTSLAELDVSAHNPNLQEVMNMYPVGVLSGVVREAHPSCGEQ